MYILNGFAYIKIVLLATVITFSIIIFPIFINFNILFSKEQKKVYFTILFFGKIKLISGYCKAIKEGICIHLTEKRAIIVPYKSFFGFRKKIQIIKDYHIYRVNSLIEMGSEESIITPLIIAFSLNYINTFIKSYFCTKKPYLKINNNYSIYEKDIFNIYISFYVIFNLLMILLSLFKSLWRYIFEGRKKQQN